MADFAFVELAPQPTAVVRATVNVSEMPAFFGRALPEVIRAIAAQGATVAGEPFGYYHGAPGEGGSVDVEAGFPVSKTVVGTGNVVASKLPGGRVVTGIHFGPFERISETYQKMMDWISGQGQTAGNDAWEVYLTDPNVEPDISKWQTKVFIPVA